MNKPQLVLLYDGECNLCSRFLRIVTRWDKHQKIHIISQFSEEGNQFLEQHDYKPLADSMLFFENGVFYDRSNAVLRVFRILSGLWPMLYAGIVLPRTLRNGIYDFIARNRYKWFGKSDVCTLHHNP